MSTHGGLLGGGDGDGGGGVGGVGDDDGGGGVGNDEGGGGVGDDEGGGGQWCENVQTPLSFWYLPQGGGDGGGALGGQSRHTCQSGRQSFSHPK